MQQKDIMINYSSFNFDKLDFSKKKKKIGINKHRIFSNNSIIYSFAVLKKILKIGPKKFGLMCIHSKQQSLNNLFFAKFFFTTLH